MTPCTCVHMTANVDGGTISDTEMLVCNHASVGRHLCAAGQHSYGIVRSTVRKQLQLIADTLVRT